MWRPLLSADLCRSCWWPLGVKLSPPPLGRGGDSVARVGCSIATSAIISSDSWDSALMQKSTFIIHGAAVPHFHTQVAAFMHRMHLILPCLSPMPVKFSALDFFDSLRISEEN